MRWLILSAVGVLLPILTWGHTSFDEEHTHEDQAQATPVVVRPESTNNFEPTGQIGQLPFSLLAKALDEDRDGLSDADEERLNTSVSNPDSDGDGFIDGLEVVRGYNPLLASPGDKIDFAAVRTGDYPASEQLKITGVRAQAGATALVITGTGPANQIGRVLVYAGELQVLAVRFDETGRFKAQHEPSPAKAEVYLVQTDAGGRPVEISERYVFTPEIAVAPEGALKVEAEDIVSGENLSGGWLGLSVVLGAGALLISIGIYVWYRRNLAARRKDRFSEAQEGRWSAYTPRSG